MPETNLISEALGARLADNKFTSLTLEPMSPEDTEQFIGLWHTAVSRELRAAEAQERLLRYERELVSLIQDRPALRTLTSNPLLCAMVCALNWDRNQRLPDDRMELYRIALELLLEGRDAERNVPETVPLERREKEEILDHLALWMLSNSYSEIPSEEAIHRIQRFLPQLGGVKADAGTVLAALIERSGVIRQPQCGIVDFIHKTFQEYMGARAAVAGGETGLLINNAHLPEWRETIVFAAGHARGQQRTKLIEGLLRPKLLQLGGRSREMVVTAVCCLETVSGNVEPHLLAALKKDARTLFPPRQLEDARILWPAAALEPDWLLPKPSDGPGIRAACIRTAAQVASRPMLNVIALCVAGGGEAVEREVLRAWPSFEFDTFLDHVVLPHPALFEGLVSKVRAEDRSLVQLLVLRYGFKRNLEQFTANLRSFIAHGIVGIASNDLTPADAELAANELMLARGLTHLNQGGGSTLVSAAGVKLIARIPDLRSLAIDRVERGSLSALAQLPSLDFLRVCLDTPDDLIDICGIASLRCLQVSGQLGDFQRLTGHRQLRRMDLRFTNIMDGKRLPRLSLDLLALPAIRNLPAMVEICQASELVLHLSRGGVKELGALRQAASLRSLHLVCNPADLLNLELELPSGLERLHVRGAQSLSFWRTASPRPLQVLTLESVQKLKFAEMVLRNPVTVRASYDAACGVDIPLLFSRYLPPEKIFCMAIKGSK